MISVETVYRYSRLASPRDNLTAYTQKILTRAIEECAIEAASMSVLYCGKTEIQRLNKQFRSIDKSTDVLSFPSDERPYLGDLAICLSIVRDQATSGKKRFEDEVALMLVHGLLHLLGYDHDTPAKEKKMWTETDRLLAAAKRIRKPELRLM